MQHGPTLIGGSPERNPGRAGAPAATSAAGAGTDRESDIRLTLPANAENVVLVRHVVAALGEVLGLTQELVDDLKLAVTEACTNVVRHAYAEGDGTLEVDVTPASHELTIVVTDHGHGLRPDSQTGGAGLGLPLMEALADGLDISQQPDSGSRVRMRFSRVG